MLPLLPAASALAPLVVSAVAAASPAAPVQWGAGAAVWPVTPAVVTAAFDPPALRWQQGHRGIDLSAASGMPVRSAVSGTVTFAGTIADRGVVVVSHGELRTTYEPLDPAVSAGSRVDAGTVIGVVGRGGHCGAGACVHWGLIRGERYLDPRLLLGLRPVLKPG